MAFKTVSKGDRISEYTLVDKIGQGGFGEVWKAEHNQIPGKHVAIKIPTRPESMELIKKEAVFQHQLDHPNIVRTIGLDLEHNPPYFIMEFVDGRNLREFMGEQGILPPPYAIDVAVQVLEALAYAHAKNIVHKDIKPENVLVERKRVKVAEHAKAIMHYVKITDLGLGNIPAEGRSSEMLVSDQARTSGMRFMSGTLFYMAPEQMLPARAVDARADIYSVGVCLYEMLTGELPLGMDLPSELNPVVPVELDAVCKKALSVDRDHRYQSAREMITDLHKAKEAFLVRLVQHGAPAAKVSPTGELRPVRLVEPGKPRPAAPVRRGMKAFEWSLVGFCTLLAMLAVWAFVKSRKHDADKNAVAPTTEPVAVALRVELAPAGVEVLVDEKRAGASPCDITLSFERHALRLSREFFVERVLDLVPRVENGRRFFDVRDRGQKDAAVAMIELNDRAALRGLSLVREKGSLKIATPGNDGAVVHLDGRAVGVTPLTLNPIDAGLYQVRISKEGFRDLDLNLMKVSGGEAVDRTYNLTPDNEIAARPEASKYREVSIHSVPPGALVYVNEMERGRTPCSFELADGTYRLHLELKYHEAHEEPLKVDGGKQTIKIPLSKVRGRVSFQTEPAGAVVLVDGREIGRTPCVESVDGGQHVAEFLVDGHFKNPYPFEVLVKDQVVPIHLALQRIPQGFISVECEVPGAEAFVDERTAGRLPVAKVKVEPGRHRVRVLGVEREVDVESGVDRKVTFTLADLGMVIVPAGDFQFGSPNPLMNESKLHTESLPAYYIDIHEMTNERYAIFWAWMQRTSDHSKCDPNEGKNKNHKPKYWDDKTTPDPKMPVVGVDWYDAVAYAAWCGKRLPTEKEWEKAARGGDDRAYPWGKEWDPTRLNWGDAKGQTDGHEGPAPVGSYETGKSPFGCYDMAGNVLEWCADLFDPTRGSSRSVRGGSCIEKMWVRTWTRDFEAPNQLMSRLGFRCVADTK